MARPTRRLSELVRAVEDDERRVASGGSGKWQASAASVRLRLREWLEAVDEETTISYEYTEQGDDDSLTLVYEEEEEEAETVRAPTPMARGDESPSGAGGFDDLTPKPTTTKAAVVSPNPRPVDSVSIQELRSLRNSLLELVEEHENQSRVTVVHQSLGHRTLLAAILLIALFQLAGFLLLSRSYARPRDDGIQPSAAVVVAASAVTAAATQPHDEHDPATALMRLLVPVPIG